MSRSNLSALLIVAGLCFTQSPGNPPPHIPAPDIASIAELLTSTPANADPTLTEKTGLLIALRDKVADLAETNEPAKETRYVWTPDHFWLTDYSASWCGPCQRWSTNEAEDILCPIDQWNIDQRPVSWVKTIPTFRLFRWDGSEWRDVKVWKGFTSAETINATIRSEIATLNNTEQPAGIPRVSETKQKIKTSQPIEQLPQRYTLTEIRTWVRQHYNSSNCCREADVRPRSAVWSHLTNDHGFTSSQVHGLSQWEALALHSAAHTGKIEATRR